MTDPATHGLETAPFAPPAAPPPPGPDELALYLRHLGDAQPLITADPANPGDPPARYVIGRELGAGAAAQVMEARDEHLGRTVALKVLPATGAVTRERLARFVAEAQVTAQLEHPAIPPVYEIGQLPGGLPYFAMRRVQGESLDAMINALRVGDAAYGRRFTPLARVRLFLRICQGIAYAHAKGVVHRDLKPANVLLGRYGEVQVMDWGLAKIHAPGVSVAGGGTDGPGDEAARAPSLRLPRPAPVRTLRSAADRRTLDGEVAGTPAYMSPEQARGLNSRVGPPADVYALGLILAEMVTLVRVMRPCSPVPPARRYADPVDARAMNPRLRVDPALAEIVARATEPLPSRRYADGGALEGAIRAYLERARRGPAEEEETGGGGWWPRLRRRLTGR